MNKRGQTLYDFLLGVSLLLVSIVIALSLFDPLFGPFTDPVSSAEEEQADRMASEIVETNATTFGDRALDIDGDTFDQGYIRKLKNQSGVSQFLDVNVTLTDKNGTVVEAGGSPVQGGELRGAKDPAARTTRVVRFPPGRAACERTCFLTVEVF